MKKMIFGLIGLAILGGAGFYFYQKSHMEVTQVTPAAPAAGAMYAMVNMQRINQLSGPTYKGLSYKENYPDGAKTARQKIETGRLPASAEPTGPTAPTENH